MKADAATLLSQRETQVAELIAWGASKKYIANRLFISVRTVENETRSIYRKLGVSKSNELSAWWFCMRYNIPTQSSPIVRRTLIFLLLAFLACIRCQIAALISMTI